MLWRFLFFISLSRLFVGFVCSIKTSIANLSVCFLKVFVQIGQYTITYSNNMIYKCCI